MKHKSFPMPDFVHYFRFPVIASLMICASFSVGTGINWLMCARFLRDSGMAIADIRHYFELCQEGEKTFDERYQILKELEEKTKKELEEAQKRYDCIEEKLRHCEEIKAGKCEDDCNPLNW